VPPPVLAAWTDPEAVAQLAGDCHWAPAVQPNEASPLSCEVHAEQTCNWNECDGEEETCVGACVAVCGACGDVCAGRCDTCKSTCRDDACRRACAASCGQCRQTCLTTKDHCATGGCRDQVITCSDRLHADYDKSGCSKRVPRFQACIEGCLKKAEEVDGGGEALAQGRECQSTCESSVMSGCERYFSYYRVY